MDARKLCTLSSVGVMLGWLALAGVAQADHQPVIAVPGNAQVPVIIDGVDASGAAVYGDFGLYAPGRVAPEIIGPVMVPIDPYGGYYYPRTGRQPRYGRQEINAPPQVLPPAPTFYREWSAGSGRGPVTTYPPFQMPEVSVEPRERRDPRERMSRQPRRRTVR